MNILLLGSGAREHGLAWKIRQSPLCGTLHAAPGNAGIADLATCHAINIEDPAAVVGLAAQLQTMFVIVGPEGPLAAGVVDALKAAGILAFGPTQSAAQLESSKAFMKEIVVAAGVPTAKYRRFTDAVAARKYADDQGAPIVIKADGLAAGKGVTIAMTVAEAQTAIDDALVNNVFGTAGAAIVIEEFMDGEELSFFALCDGKTAVSLGGAQDHKRVGDGDTGLNTGGMGAYAPVPWLTGEMQRDIMDQIIHPVLHEMQVHGAPFTGILFAGLMKTDSGFKVIEFNARFGDPETQVILPRLGSDIVEYFHAAAKGELAAMPTLSWKSQAALCVVMAANGYPGSYNKGSIINGVEKAAAMPGVQLFHAGTARNEASELTANGGRVLSVVGLGSDLQDAKSHAYKALMHIDWPDGFYRHDIGWRALS